LRGTRVERSEGGAMSQARTGGERERSEGLKEIVRDLHEGSDIRAVRRRFAELIRNVGPEEIAEMEQALIAEGVPVEQVQQVCDIHVQVFEDALSRKKKSRTLPGHPVHTFMEENRRARKILRRLRPLLRQVPRGARGAELERELEELKKIDLHYQRKENQLFPLLERTGFTGPSKVMWGKHDEIRAELRSLEKAYREKDWKRFASAGRSVIRAIRRMMFMEERILFPTALRKLDDSAWAEIRSGEGDIGYAWVDPGNLWDPSVVRAAAAAREAAQNLGRGGAVAGAGGPPVPAGGGNTAGEGTTAGGAGPAGGAGGPDSGAAGAVTRGADIPLDVGRLSPGQVNLMLENLPVDVTYVDENDRVRYYSQGRERIFPRSPAVIGREVQNCHPPASVHVVQKILDSFRRGEKDTAEFWLTLGERFIHIRYFALYAQDGAYKGVLEVSQDVTEIRNLKGERRLLDW
jgi:DUF438 domain-containing protein